MNNIIAIAKRELKGYFETPVAYVFIVVFLLMSGIFTFYIGGFYESGQADLMPFFGWHVWLYLFMIPAVSMRLWAEENKTGTVELLLTLPISSFEAVMGKYLAAWIFSGIALSLTFPVWVTANYLGNPDNSVILAGYLGSFIMAGAFLSLGSCMSSLTRNQVISFVLSVTMCFFFIVSGFSLVINFFESIGFSQVFIDAISSFSFISNFEEISKGIISLKAMVFLISFIALWLFLNVLVVETNRA